MKLMTNILPSYYSFIEKEAKRSHKSKREVVEKAIALYIKEMKKKQILSQYKAMGKDEEYRNELTEDAELGIEYFLTETDDGGK